VGRGRTLAVLAVVLLLGGGMTHRWLLLAGSGGSFTAPLPSDLVALFNGYDSSTSYRIGAATKTGTDPWAKDASNPVLDVGAGGTWDDTHVKDPQLIHDGSGYVAYYSGNDGSNFRVGRATASALTGPWTKDAGNPVLDLGAGGDFDDAGIEFASVLYEPADTGREWKMWYGGLKASDSRWRAGYAYSTDGVSWTKHGQVLDIGASGQWDDEGVIPFDVVNDGGTYHVFYGGRQSPSSTPFWQGGVATTTDPEGSYTKHAGNPTQLVRSFEVASTSIDLTANASPGATTLTLSTTTPFSAGEVVVLTDTSTDAEVFEVESIDSGTVLTLRTAVVGTFTTGDQARLRPATRNGVVPATVRPAAGGWQMFGVAFQTLSDLTVGGSPLRELSLRWTASSLTGVWTLDNDSGLLLSLGGASDWDRYSAENMSVIPAP
jgi:hypothetical protein